jgi:hypothetical protein
LQPDDPLAVSTIFALAEGAAELKEELPELLLLLQIWLRDLLLLAAGMPPSLVVSRDLSDLLPRATGRWRREQLLASSEQFAGARRYLQVHCNRALVCEVLFFGLL